MFLVLFSALLLLFFLSCSIFVILECKSKMGLAIVFDWAYKWGFFLRLVGLVVFQFGHLFLFLLSLFLKFSFMSES
jgi:hypothetical protein